MNKDKERLEKAKKILNHIKGYGVYDGNDDIEIFEWLIEQAEQKQSLETTVDFYQSALRDADRRVQELENVNRVLKKANVGSERAKERLWEWIDEFEIDNERYREALEAIAYFEDKEEGEVVTRIDAKYIARKALEE